MIYDIVAQGLDTVLSDRCFFSLGVKSMNKLYVGNLPYNTTAEDLKSLFSQYGEIVDVKLISDFATGRSKGFGFVELSDNSSAAKAVSELNGKDYQGRPLRVSEAREKQAGGGGRGGRGGDRGGRGDRGGNRSGGSRWEG